MPHRLTSLLLLATLLGAASLTAAAEASLEASQARAAADAAEEQLVEARRTLWAQLDAAGKQHFAQRERAWLNGGQSAAVQHCAGPAATELAWQQCRLQVAQAHRAALVPPLASAAGR